MLSVTEATQIAVLMMLQEDFSNEIGSFLAVYSCHHFMKNHPLDELYPKPVSENKEEEDDEEVISFWFQSFVFILS